MKHKLDKYDLFLEKIGYPFKGETTNNVNTNSVTKEKVDNGSMNELLNELGILMSNESTYNLIIWNDDYNDMLHVVLTLQKICKLSNLDTIEVMREAHFKGKAIAKSGSLEEMNKMKQGLNDNGIEATVEK